MSLINLLPEDYLARRAQKRTNLLCAKGNVKLGRGDFGIGAKVPLLMDRVGLSGIDVKMNDQPYLMLPPYRSLRQRYYWKCQMGALGRQAKQRRGFMQQIKKLLLAGGGTLTEYRKIARLTSGGSSHNRQLKKQLREKTYYTCGAGPFYVIKGRKTKP